MLDPQAYEEGRAAFAAGTTLRAVAERIMAAGPAEEDKVMSLALGFADELITLLRHPAVVVNAPLQFPVDSSGKTFR